jgi:hypothetical protein
MDLFSFITSLVKKIGANPPFRGGVSAVGLCAVHGTLLPSLLQISGQSYFFLVYSIY